MGLQGEGIQGLGDRDVDLEDITADSITVGAGTAAAPSVTIGETGTGIYLDGTGKIGFTTTGSEQFNISTTWFLGINFAGPLMINRAATLTIPTFMPNQADSNSGLGWAAADQPVMVAGGVQAQTWVEDGGVLQLSQCTAGITADTGSSQGDGPLTSSFNEISVCANAGDAVTMPAAIVNQSYIVTIINNGAQACDVFPASGDDLGAGADTAVSLAAGANITYRNYDATNYVALT